MNIKNFLPLIILSTLLISCQEKSNDVITADLTFKSVSFANAWKANDEEFKTFSQELDKSLKNPEKLSENELAIYTHYDKLRKLNLLRSPYIFLNIEKDSVITVFLPVKEYEKVKHLNQIDLYKEGKKAVLELELKEKDSNIFYSNSIINVTKVNGKSRSNI